MRTLAFAFATVAAVAFAPTGAFAQQLGCTTGGAGGLFPTSGTGNGTYQTVLPTFPMTSTLNVPSIPPGATCVTEVKLNGMTHTYTGDVQYVLTSPSGQKINLFNRQGGANDWGGDYVINSVEQGAPLPTAVGGIYPTGSTFSQSFGTWTGGNFAIDNVALSAVPAATGDWTLTIYDWVSGDIGTLTSWDICFGTPPPIPPPTLAPTLTAPAANANVTGLFVALSWGSVLGATSYEVDVDGTIVAVPGTSYSFQSTVGTHTWTARGVNNSGAGPWALSRSFTDTGLATPALTTPAANAAVFGPSVNLVWGAVSGASGYDVDVDGTVFSVAASPFAYTSAPGVHNWKVRAKWLNNTVVGPYSVARTFTDLGAPPTPCNGSTLTTVPFTGGNGLGTNSGVYFDINVLNPAGITLSQLATNANATAGTAFTLEIYTKSGTYVGFETTAAAWTLRATGGGVAVGNNTAPGALVEFPDFTLPTGVTGFCLKIIGAGHSYTNGNGGNQTYTNADMTITLGKAQAAVFTGALNNPRVWNGTVIYNCNVAPPVINYCTAGTSTNGCTPAISAANQPKVTLAGTCTISVSGLEGQKQGLIFYGINNSGFTPTPWASGSSSFLCVKAPTQRLPASTTGGTTGQCDGNISADLHAYLAGNPTAIGLPLVAGNKVYAQTWYRDPPAVKTTNLTNALELTVIP